MTRAVVIGVSDYLDPDIPDLRYAHVDAREYALYLQRSSGSSGMALHSARLEVQLLLNQQATGGNVSRELAWLLRESKQGDRCIIYFSGHGDVETRSEKEAGHLLLYDTPSETYQINSLRLDDLRDIITELTVQQGAEVIIITDACRSGHLAGSHVRGSQATAAHLLTQYSNEIKIMSCQPDEYSYEGEQWGNGRGLFSYHLIHGLQQDADENRDGAINLKEIHRHLEDMMDEEQLSSSQTPVVQGDRKALIATLSLSSDQHEEADFTKKEEPIAADRDLWQEFYHAMDHNQLIATDVDEEALYAMQLLAQLESAEAESSRLALARGDLIAALQDHAQLAINLYLSLDDAELHRRWSDDGQHYDRIAQYLNHAADLCGPTHYIYAQLRAKTLYFNTVAGRIALDRDSASSESYATLLAPLEEAMALDPRAPYIINEQGLLYDRMGNHPKAISAYEDAIAISPTWALPYNNIAYSHTSLGQEGKAITAFKALQNKFPDFSLAYENEFHIHYDKGDFRQAILPLTKYLAIDSSKCLFLNNVGYLHYRLQEYDEAIRYLNKALACDPSMSLAYINKSLVHRAMHDYTAAIESLQNNINMGDIDPWNHYDIAMLQLLQTDTTLAEESLRQAIALDSTHRAQLALAELFLYTDREDLAMGRLDYYARSIDPESSELHFLRAGAYVRRLARDHENIDAHKRDIKGFSAAMSKAISAGFDDLQRLESSSLFDAIRSEKEYTEIIKQLSKK